MLDDIESALTASVANDGQTTTTAVVPFASGVKTNTVAENTSNSGVTIDGTLIKDGTIYDTGGNESLILVATGSAVNELTVTNSATGNAVSSAATGDDTNIDYNLISKGTGTVQANGLPLTWTYETINTTTGGTTIDFTGIPSGITDIDVFCFGVSLSGTQEVNVRIGPSGGLETSGYVGGVTSIAGTPTDTTFAAANQFVMNEAAAAADNYILVAHLRLGNPATNLWSWTGQGNSSASGARYVSVGQKALAGALNLLTVKSNSTDTFDVNGGVQIRYR